MRDSFGYPFGMGMPQRSYSAGNQYRYGFNGKENDNEVKGEGNQQDYGMRIYDPRLGRFLSVDPITKDYPELTPYQFASNSPIAGSDLDGLEFEDRKAIEAELAKMRIEKQQQVKQKVEIQQKVSTGSLLKYGWRGVRDSYKATMSTFSSSSIRNTLNNAGGTAKDFGGMIVGKPGAAKSFSERATNFSTGVANTVTEPVNFLATMHTRSANENAYGIGYYGFQVGAGYTADRITGELSAGNRLRVANFPEGRTFNHFTNSDGVTGITGINTKLLDKLAVGESLTVNQLSFGAGKNSFMANAVGDNFVTDLGANATSRQLEGIGVFGDKQNFAISFSEKAAFNQGVKVKGSNPERGIYTIPANSTFKGAFKITKTK